MRDPEFGTQHLGRLKYRTEEEARAAASDLDLDSVHSHTMDADGDGQKETIHMPGSSHDKLNKSLTERGLPPQPSRAKMQKMKDKSDDSSGVTDGGAGLMNADMGGLARGMPQDAMDGATGRADESSLFDTVMAKDGEADGQDGLFKSPTGDEDDDGDMEIY